MTDSIGHRGPDGVGYFVHNEVGLGHRRLSIIDVEGGAQPIGNEDGTVQVVFNGEIYNFIELRKELLSFGHVFKTRSDTEVIVHAYEQWGMDFVNRLNGMFAFALFDLSKKKLLLARDHLGIKPLYYTTVGSQFLFASEIKSLMQHPKFRREVDREALAQLFTFRYVPSPKSLMKDVFKLPPGHLMVVSGRGVEVHRFWTQVPCLRVGAKEGDLIEEYQELLEDVVRMQLRSDVPLGLFLSSGIDSGVLLALMSSRSERPVEAFTIDFEDGQETNESSDAARVARRFGVKYINVAKVAEFAREMDQHTLYLFDVRSPEEYAAGHLHSTVSAPGGQLVQATDSYAGVRNARVVLIDDHGVRATMTASWLIQMGWQEVYVVKDALSSGPLHKGAAPIEVLGLDKIRCDMLSPAALKRELDRAAVTVIDFDSKPRYGEGHVPGAWHAIRANLAANIEKIPRSHPLVLTSADGIVAKLAAPEAARLTGMPVKVLTGGTAAWRRAQLPLEQGLSRLTDNIDDVWVRAHDRTENREQAMQDYLTWEVDLITQIGRDDDVGFRHFPPTENCVNG